MHVDRGSRVNSLFFLLAFIHINSLAIKLFTLKYLTIQCKEQT